MENNTNFYSTDELELRVIKGRTFVLKQPSETAGVETANFMNTGKALCGILRKKETLAAWINRYNKNYKRIEAEVKKINPDNIKTYPDVEKVKQVYAVVFNKE